MSARLDQIAPSYIGARRITLALADPREPLRANKPVAITVSYVAAAPEGISLPLELICSPPTLELAQRFTFRRFLPAELTITPRETGRHIITLREIFHNRWGGSLALDVPLNT